MVMTKRREQLVSTSNHLNDNVGLTPELTISEWSLRRQLEKIGWLRCLIIERESPQVAYRRLASGGPHLDGLVSWEKLLGERYAY